MAKITQLVLFSATCEGVPFQSGTAEAVPWSKTMNSWTLYTPFSDGSQMNL